MEAAQTNFANCSKLATLYTVREHAQRAGKAVMPEYSFAAAPVVAEPERIGRYGNTEFYQAIDGKSPAETWKIIDELMDTLRVVNKRVYDSIIAKINRL